MAILAHTLPVRPLGSFVDSDGIDTTLEHKSTHCRLEVAVSGVHDKLHSGHGTSTKSRGRHQWYPHGTYTARPVCRVRCAETNDKYIRGHFFAKIYENVHIQCAQLRDSYNIETRLLKNKE